MTGTPDYDIPEDLLPPWCSAQLARPYHVKWGGNEWIVRLQWVMGVLGKRRMLAYTTENLLEDQGALRWWFKKCLVPELNADVSLVNAQWTMQKKIGRALGVPERMLPLRNMGYRFWEEVEDGARWRDAGLRWALRVLWRVVVRARPDLADY